MNNEYDAMNKTLRIWSNRSRDSFIMLKPEPVIRPIEPLASHSEDVTFERRPLLNELFTWRRHMFPEKTGTVGSSTETVSIPSRTWWLISSLFFRLKDLNDHRKVWSVTLPHSDHFHLALLQACHRAASRIGRAWQPMVISVLLS